MSVLELGAPLAAAAAWMVAMAGLRADRRHPLALGEYPRTRPASSPRRAQRAESRNAHREVPQFLDLLAAGSTAGLSAELSFRRAVACLRGSLARALGDVVHAVDLGTPWRQAFATYAETSGDADLRRTVAVLARTETLGVPLSEATRELAPRSERRVVPKRSNVRGRRRSRCCSPWCSSSCLHSSSSRWCLC